MFDDVTFGAMLGALALTARVAELEACLERAEISIDHLGSENAQLHAFLSH